MKYYTVPLHTLSALRSYSTKTASQKLIYTSPQVGLIQLAKRFSLATLGISSLSSPVLLYLWQDPVAQDVGLNSNMFLGAAMASALSTGALHFLLSPYINTIRIHVPEDKKDAPVSVTPNTLLSIETLNIFARPCTTTLRVRDLLPVNESSILTWTVKKSSLQNQYLLEQQKGITPTIKQTRFWLDKRNGMGDRDAMASLLRVVESQGRPQRI